ncbi:MAG: hypothetical protein AAF307_10770 [Pseudomonadota bacterium]
MAQILTKAPAAIATIKRDERLPIILEIDPRRIFVIIHTSSCLGEA